jgi:GNAT superfamily N-acetyltransferase
VRPCYLLQVPGAAKPAIADVTWFGEPFNCHVVTRINVPRELRGQGHGTRLLEEVLRDADEQGLRLMLAPEPSDGLDHEAVVAWYGRHGFEFTRSGAMMERGPS